jgi:Bifunctional PLP-dependent enzyme with beta-cystathionase and maltose regulon repressor activities
MKYNFDEIIPRRGTNSYKWDSAEDADVLPMWVADMDFRTAPPVVEALKKRVEHGISVMYVYLMYTTRQL